MPTDAKSDVRDRLDRLVHSHPRQAIAEARRWAQDSADDPALLLEVWGGLGRALFELGDSPRAVEAMRQALRSAALLPDDARSISVRISAAAVFAQAGDLRESLRQLDLAQSVAAGATLGRVRTQRAFVFSHVGRLREALTQADLADADFAASGDELGRLRLLVTRSQIDLQRGDLAAAEADLVVARAIAESLDQDVIAAGIVANLGVLHARSGRTLTALQHFDTAHQQYVESGSPLRAMAVLEADRAEALLNAGMFAEAVSASLAAVANATASGSLVSRGEAELFLARAQLAAGALKSAQRCAVAATRTLQTGRRNAVALQARAVGLEAALGFVTAPSDASRLLERSRRVAQRLDDFGWAAAAADMRCARLRCASRLQRLADVEDDIGLLRTATGSRHPSTAIQGWYAEALGRWREHDVAGALQAARSGMSMLEQHRMTSADPETRAGVSAIGRDVATLAMHLAIDEGTPGAVFGWAERTRAHAFRLERLAGDVEAAPPTMAETARALDGRTLVEYVIDRGVVWAVVVSSRTKRLVRLGAVGEISRASEQLAGWMTRGTQPDDPGDAQRPRRVATVLDDLLLGGLGLTDDAELVLVPVGILHAVAWSSLPSLSARPFVVVPSARSWLEAERRSAPGLDRHVGLVIGPDVLGSAIEQTSIERCYPASTVRRGEQATGEALRQALSECDVVQVAAHGHFRVERPMLSSLRLDDGEVTVFDLASSPVCARLVVLSSCEGGVHGVVSGSEILGLASVLLSLGAATVVAPTHVVADRVCAEFVSELHDIWSTGIPIAAALATVRQRWMTDPTLIRWATASAFMCFGSGSTSR